VSINLIDKSRIVKLYKKSEIKISLTWKEWGG
jgi:hypothetical protein